MNIKKQYIWLALIVLLGIFLRFYNLGFKSLWLDEAVNYSNSKGSVTEIIEKNSIRGSGPPTFTFIVSAISKICSNEFSLRLPSCLAGIAAILIVYLLLNCGFNS